MASAAVGEPDAPALFARYPSLEGRVAFISGGATGLGREFVAQLAAQGARVAFVDLDDGAAESLAAEITGRGHPAPLYRHVDVRSIPELTAAIEAAGETLGPISVLVSNAANDTRDELDEIDPELWDERMAVNLRHHFFAARAVAGQMRAAGGGSIINLGSISAHADFTGMPVYIAAKAGVEGLTRTLARELGPDRIRVNCIVPGWVLTQRQLDEWITPEALDHIARAQCLPQNLYPDDVARLMLWLAADDSRACTGQKWVVDGGWL